MKRISAIFSICIFIITGCAQDKDFVVTIKTNHGDMIAVLYDETPKHKENFIKLASQHFFDSSLFHRTIAGFMIQGGDPDSKKARPGEQLGRGGPGYTIDAEVNPTLFHEKGALSAARLGNAQNPGKASNGSQFYIVHGTKMSEQELKVDQIKLNQALQQFFQNPANKPAYDSMISLYRSGNMKGTQDYALRLKPRAEKATGIITEKEISGEKLKTYTTVGGAPALDGEYTVFGRLIKGLDVLDKIATVAKDGSDRPLEDVHMIVTIEEMPKRKIKKLYGYEYPEK